MKLSGMILIGGLSLSCAGSWAGERCEVEFISLADPEFSQGVMHQTEGPEASIRSLHLATELMGSSVRTSDSGQKLLTIFWTGWVSVRASRAFLADVFGGDRPLEIETLLDGEDKLASTRTGTLEDLRWFLSRLNVRASWRQPRQRKVLRFDVMTDHASSPVVIWGEVRYRGGHADMMGVEFPAEQIKDADVYAALLKVISATATVPMVRAHPEIYLDHVRQDQREGHVHRP